MKPTRRILTTAVVSFLLVASACGTDGDDSDGIASLGDVARDGGTDGDDAAPSDGDLEAAALAYSQCMRDHGIEMPDPEFHGDGGLSISVSSDDDAGSSMPGEEDFLAAEEACGPIMRDAFGEVERDPEAEAEMFDQMLAVARCMRERGHNMPDPQMTEDGGIMVESFDDGSQGSHRDGDDFGTDDDFVNDLDACHDAAGMAGAAIEVDE